MGLLSRRERRAQCEVRVLPLVCAGALRGRGALVGYVRPRLGEGGGPGTRSQFLRAAILDELSQPSQGSALKFPHRAGGATSLPSFVSRRPPAGHGECSLTRTQDCSGRVLLGAAPWHDWPADWPAPAESPMFTEILCGLQNRSARFDSSVPRLSRVAFVVALAPCGRDLAIAAMSARPKPIDRGARVGARVELKF